MVDSNFGTSNFNLKFAALSTSQPPKPKIATLWPDYQILGNSCLCTTVATPGALAFIGSQPAKVYIVRGGPAQRDFSVPTKTATLTISNLANQYVYTLTATYLGVTLAT